MKERLEKIRQAVKNAYGEVTRKNVINSFAHGHISLADTIFYENHSHA